MVQDITSHWVFKAKLAELKHIAAAAGECEVICKGRDVKFDSLVKSVSPNAENSVDFIPTFLTSFFLTVPKLLW